MTRWRAGCLAAVIVLSGARLLGAQDSRLADRFPPAAANLLGSIVDSAAREGLPSDPLVLRALEGQAKGATTVQIVDALGRLRDALRTARNTLGPDSHPAELVTAAAALQANVPLSRLAELHKLAEGRPVTAPLGAYLELVARGAPAAQAWDRIADLVRHRASDADFGRLTPADVNRDPGPARATRNPVTAGPP